MTWWGEAMGSIVLMDGELFAANKINDAFVVISTDGHPDVPVNYENQPVGKTNNNGYLLISGVSAYYPASYSINTLNLPGRYAAERDRTPCRYPSQQRFFGGFPDGARAGRQRDSS